MKTIEPISNSASEQEIDSSEATTNTPETIESEEVILNSFDASIQPKPVTVDKNIVDTSTSHSTTTTSSSIYIWVAIIATLLLLVGGIGLFDAINTNTQLQSGEQNTAAQFSKYLGIVFSAAYIVCALGLFLRNDTLRSITVILIALNMLLSIGTLIFILFSPLPLILFFIQLAIVIFLSSNKVKDTF